MTTRSSMQRAADKLNARAATVPALAPLAIVACIAIGIGCVVRYYAFSGPQAELGYLAVSTLPVVALIVGPLIYRQPSRWPWHLLAAGQAAFLVGDLFWMGADAARGTVSLADAAYLLGYPLTAAGLALFIRDRQSMNRLLPLIDALAIGVAAALLLWLAYSERFFQSAGDSVMTGVVILAYPAGDALLVGAATYLLLIERRGRGLSQALIVASLVLVLLADLLYYGRFVTVAGGARSWVDGLWLLSYLAIALAPLVPSMRQTTLRQRELPVIDRLILLGIAVGLVPTFAILQQVVTGSVDALAVTIGEVLVGGLALLRLQAMGASERRRERRYALLLERASDAFTLIDPSGIVVFASPASEHLLGIAPNVAVGRPVTEFLDRIVDLDLAVARNLLDAVLATPGSTLARRVRARAENGTLRWLEIVASNRTAEPEVGGLVVSCRDVSEQVGAEQDLQRRHDLMAETERLAGVGSWELDMGTHSVRWSEENWRILGFDPRDGEPSTEAFFRCIHPDDVERVNRAYERWMRSGEPVDVRFRFIRPDGAHRHLRTVARAVERDPDGKFRMIGANLDVTAEVEAGERLARLGTAIEQSNESVVITDAGGRIEYVNPAFERVTGYRREEVIGENPRILKSGVQPDAFYDAMWAALTSGQPWLADFVNRRKDGTLYEASGVVSPIRDDRGEITGYVAVKRDVTDERRLQARAERLARERVLIAETIHGITTRESPEAMAGAICRQVARLGGVVNAGCFVFGLDGRAAPIGFVVNGHGEAVLKRVPRERTQYLRDQAAKGPWIEAWKTLPGHPYSKLFAEIGVRAIAYAPMRHGEDLVGFLQISSAEPDARELLADELPALVEFADITGSLVGPALAARSEIEAVRLEIRRVMREGAFDVHFQPIVEVGANRIVGYEALTRFGDGVPPDVRFAEADSVGLSQELELRTLAKALERSRSLPHGAWLTLNASPHLILHSQALRDLLRTTDREIFVEVTEHAEISDYDAFAAAVHDLGPSVRLAVDDAGAGFASLRHILELHPSVVKLDRGLIVGIDEDDARRALVAGMRHFAESTRIMLIAEGVERPSELAALRDLGIRLAQGYLLGRPVSADRVQAPERRHASPEEPATKRPAAGGPRRTRTRAGRVRVG